MVGIYECHLEVMERIFFASSEFGKEYKTKGFIGNTALPYALSLIPVHHIHFDKPKHREDFKELNERGIYISPVTFFKISFVLDRFNSISERDGVSVMPNDRNNPNEGIFKLISRGSKGVFYIVSREPIRLSRYIRVGKFMSKCKITQKKLRFKEKNGIYKTSIILRAEDIPSNLNIYNYEKTIIQNGTYLKNLEMDGSYYDISSEYLEDVRIPSESMFYATT